MKMRILICTLGSLLVGCGTETKPENKAELSLENLFFYSINELQDKFGKANVQTKLIEACETCGPEGTPLEESFYTTTLFPDSKKEVVITWNSNQTLLTDVNVERDGNEWRTKEGFRLGDSISKINQYFKNPPIKLVYENYFYFNVNDYYTLMFESNDLNFDNLDFENLMSGDARLKNLVLVAISIRLPGYTDN
jgi:hypothetical protein